MTKINKLEEWAKDLDLLANELPDGDSLPEFKKHKHTETSVAVSMSDVRRRIKALASAVREIQGLPTEIRIQVENRLI